MVLREVQQQIVRKSREFREDFTNGINTFKFSPDESPADAFATADALAAVAADELVADALVADELDTGALVADDLDADALVAAGARAPAGGNLG